MPFIQVNLGAGRTAAQKDTLLRGISAAAPVPGRVRLRAAGQQLGSTRR